MIRAGIIFGGSSREREVSFSGGRTVFDNLDKTRFTPVPLFVDSFNNFILLRTDLIYKGSIRDFFPPAHVLPEGQEGIQVYIESLLPQIESGKLDYDQLLKEIGRKVELHELPQLIDVAFLALHGNYGEDGTIQGLLEWLKIPYTGSGIFASAFGMDKSRQKTLLQQFSGTPQYFSIARHNWDSGERASLFEEAARQVGFPMVIKSANQGSSIGISVLRERDDHAFEKAVEKAFFRVSVSREKWQGSDKRQRIEFIREICDPRSGLGLPLYAAGNLLYQPSELFSALDKTFAEGKSELVLEAADGETEVLIEQFIEGREFSCIVIQDKQARPFALPPTEIIKTREIFDYRSKYLPGQAYKVTPIDIDEASLTKIRHAAENLFTAMGCTVYARIDGFLKPDGTIYLNDPNTTSGMMPSSFFFHQASEVGLDPSRFLSYIILQSLYERQRSGKPYPKIAEQIAFLESQKDKAKDDAQKIRVGVVMGGYTAERHISMESGRNIYEKLASSAKYKPVPVFLTGSNEAYTMYTLPVNMMLKDNADDIAAHIRAHKKNAGIEQIRKESAQLFTTYGIPVAQDAYEPHQVDVNWLRDNVDVVFIALHGRPGEDGTIQKDLDRLGVPYNGSGPDSSNLTINKFETSNTLKASGFHAAKNLLVTAEDWAHKRAELIEKVEKEIGYPLIAKPVDEGCSAAVKKIKTREQLEAYATVMFRSEALLPAEAIRKIGTDAKEEWPPKPLFLIENFIDKGDAKYFLEVTGGFLTHLEPGGNIRYEMFEPSESVAEQEILSLEEKFLAGQGQNITPARYGHTAEENKRISGIVKEELKKAAALLHIEGYARIDAFVKVLPDDKVEVHFIEVNSLPGMTPATCIFHQSAINGYLPYEFIDKILEFGMAKKKQQVEQSKGR